MSNKQTKSTKHRSSNETAEIRPREPNTEKQEACSDVNKMSTSFTSPLKNSMPVVAEANFDTETRKLNVILANWNLVSLGKSNTLHQQFSCNCHLHAQDDTNFKDGDVQSDSGSKAEDCSLDRGKTSTELVGYQLQPLSEAQDCKQADSGEMFIVSVDPLLSLIKKQGYLNGQQCERILEQLELLQDNGKFGEHERLVTTYIQRCANGKNADMEIALKIERGVAFSYQKDFKNSKRVFTSIIKSKENHRNILMARAYFLLVADYRSRKSAKLPPLFEFLRRSEYLLQNHDSPEDWAELYYNYGSVWLAYMSIIPDDQRNAQARNAARAKARYYYEQAISFCKKDHRLRVQIKKQMYIHLKLAALLLDCSSTAARTQEKPIPPSDIKEAKEHLNFVQYELGDSVPTGTRVQLLKTRSDQFYRQGLYQIAKETAEEAFQLASSNRFNTELDTLQERIKILEKKLEKFKLIVIRELEYSSSESCCNESD